MTTLAEILTAGLARLLARCQQAGAPAEALDLVRAAAEGGPTRPTAELAAVWEPLPAARQVARRLARRLEEAGFRAYRGLRDRLEAAGWARARVLVRAGEGDSFAWGDATISRRGGGTPDEYGWAWVAPAGWPVARAAAVEALLGAATQDSANEAARAAALAVEALLAAVRRAGTEALAAEAAAEVADAEAAEARLLAAQAAWREARAANRARPAAPVIEASAWAADWEWAIEDGRRQEAAEILRRAGKTAAQARAALEPAAEANRAAAVAAQAAREAEEAATCACHAAALTPWQERVLERQQAARAAEARAQQVAAHAAWQAQQAAAWEAGAEERRRQEEAEAPARAAREAAERAEAAARDQAYRARCEELAPYAAIVEPLAKIRPPKDRRRPDDYGNAQRDAARDALRRLPRPVLDLNAQPDYPLRNRLLDALTWYATDPVEAIWGGPDPEPARRERAARERRLEEARERHARYAAGADAAPAKPAAPASGFDSRRARR